MPLTRDGRYDPKKVLKSKTTKKLVGDGLDTAGLVEVDVMSGGLPLGPTIRIGLLVKANQTIRKFRYRSSNHDVLTSHDPAVEADLNATLLRPWEKDTLKWVGFSVPIEKIPVSATFYGKMNVDVEFSLKPFAAGSAQDMVIVFQPGSESFGNGHFNYGVSVLKPSGAASAKPAPKKAAPKAAKSKSASKGRSTRRSR